MMRINLLPWREELRALQQRRFFILLGVSLMSIGLLWLVLHQYCQYRIYNQQKFNTNFKQQLVGFAEQIRSIQMTQNQSQQLIKQLHMLDEAHIESVRRANLFEAFARIMPNNVSLTNLQCLNDEITLTGLSESNAEVTVLIRHLSNIKGVQHPTLSEIKEVQSSGLYRYGFMVKANLS